MQPQGDISHPITRETFFFFWACQGPSKQSFGWMRPNLGGKPMPQALMREVHQQVSRQPQRIAVNSTTTSLGAGPRWQWHYDSDSRHNRIYIATDP